MAGGERTWEFFATGGRKVEGRYKKFNELSRSMSIARNYSYIRVLAAEHALFCC